MNRIALCCVGLLVACGGQESVQLTTCKMHSLNVDFARLQAAEDASRSILYPVIGEDFCGKVSQGMSVMAQPPEQVRALCRNDRAAACTQLAYNTYVLQESLRSLPHEILHVWLVAKTGDADAGHTRPEWPALWESESAQRWNGIALTSQ